MLQILLQTLSLSALFLNASSTYGDLQIDGSLLELDDDLVTTDLPLESELKDISSLPSPSELVDELQIHTDNSVLKTIKPLPVNKIVNERQIPHNIETATRLLADDNLLSEESLNDSMSVGCKFTDRSLINFDFVGDGEFVEKNRILLSVMCPVDRDYRIVAASYGEQSHRSVVAIKYNGRSFGAVLNLRNSSGRPLGEKIRKGTGEVELIEVVAELVLSDIDVIGSVELVQPLSFQLLQVN